MRHRNGWPRLYRRRRARIIRRWSRLGRMYHLLEDLEMRKYDKPKHVVRTVGFSEAAARRISSEEAYIECACDWFGQVFEWQAHRGSLPRTTTLGPAGESHWTASRKK